MRNSYIEKSETGEKWGDIDLSRAVGVYSG